MGPHGLCVGATGSGKSEFLRTLTLGLVATHPPEALNLVLVDFKGGATFLGFERLNHVAAVITNLADEAHLVARMRDALSGELNRRQELLRAAGNVANVADYESARRRGVALAPLPTLFIVVDEFSELLSQHPDFVELFVAIGRVGRSLGMHLLLASQRLEEGRLRGLETHLSYRICLKTFSASESRAVLGTADAFDLPNTPGAAYLKTASGDLVRFQSAYVSGPVAARGSAVADRVRAAAVPFTAVPVGRTTTDRTVRARRCAHRAGRRDRRAGRAGRARTSGVAGSADHPTDARHRACPDATRASLDRADRVGGQRVRATPHTARRRPSGCGRKRGRRGRTAQRKVHHVADARPGTGGHPRPRRRADLRSRLRRRRALGDAVATTCRRRRGTLRS